MLVLQGPALLLEAANALALPLLDGPASVGRPFEEVCAADSPGDLVRAVRDCYRGDVEWKAADGVWAVVPTHDSAGRVDGVLMYGRPR